MHFISYPNRRDSDKIQPNSIESHKDMQHLPISGSPSKH